MNHQQELETKYETAALPRTLRDEMYRRAYEEGHAYGLSEVANEYADLADLVGLCDRITKEQASQATVLAQTLSNCTTEQLHMMSHAVGHLKRSDRPRAHAHKLAQCYRNYYCTEPCQVWDDLVTRGLASRQEGNCVYKLTEAGFKVLTNHRAALLADVKAATDRLRRAFS